MYRSIGVVLLIMLAGCARSGQPPTSTAQPQATTTVAMSPATSSDEPEIAELAATGENLPPGLYTRSNFEPPIRLELDGSWEAVQIADGFFDVQKLAGTPDVIAVQFANVMGVVGATGVVEPDNAADAVDILGENQNLSVIETSSSRLGDSLDPRSPSKIKAMGMLVCLRCRQAYSESTLAVAFGLPSSTPTRDFSP